MTDLQSRPAQHKQARQREGLKRSARKNFTAGDDTGSRSLVGPCEVEQAADQSLWLVWVCNPAIKTLPKTRLVTGRVRCAFTARTPHINAGEQEDPDNVHEMPVPGGEFKCEMLRRSEMAEIRADQAHDQKRRADDDMETVEAGRHEERS